jgi:hypothetical protein
LAWSDRRERQPHRGSLAEPRRDTRGEQRGEDAADGGGGQEQSDHACPEVQFVRQQDDQHRIANPGEQVVARRGDRDRPEQRIAEHETQAFRDLAT